jgi:glyceraldehyde 3-phosphate dehydrogenase
MALRVPIPDGSITDLVVTLGREVTAEEVNEAYRDRRRGRLKGILEYTTDPIVSIDIVGNPHSCILDSLSTMANGQRRSRSSAGTTTSGATPAGCST